MAILGHCKLCKCPVCRVKIISFNQKENKIRSLGSSWPPWSSLRDGEKDAVPKVDRVLMIIILVSVYQESWFL